VAATQASGKTPRKIRNSPGKLFSPGRPSDREERDAHQPGQHRRRLAQAAKLVDAAMTAGALLHHGHKPEERRRRDAVVEHLQDHAV
jgi:hypothetical protein